jgi:hypothetical protein
MKRGGFVLASAVSMCAAVGLQASAAAPPASAPTADDIIARQIAARGGLDKLKAIQSLKFEGKMLVNGGAIQLRLVQYQKRPGLTRTEATLQGLTVVQAYDGSSGWQIQPFDGRKDPEKLSADDTKDLVDQADIDGPLVDYKAKGATVEYLGTEDVDGTSAYKLRVTEKSGDRLIYDIDADTLMTIRIATTRLLRGREDNTVADYGDYEKVGGVYFPFETESGPPGAADSDLTKIEFDTGEADVAIDDAKFRMSGK